MELQSDQSDAGKRLDHFLQERMPEYSRSRLQEWVKAGRVKVDGAAQKPSHVLHGGEAIRVEPAELAPLRAFGQDLPLDILYEDEAIVAVNKPAGMTVHAGAGVHSGTLVNALVHRFAALSQVGGELRPGIVHRLDRYTSGVVLVARTDAAHRALAAQFAGRKVEKVYIALVEGIVKAAQGRIETPITRDPVQRIRMTTKTGVGRAASTEYRVVKRFAGHTLLEVKIGTGRTHQIRVHLSSIGHPVAGDKVYGGKASVRGRFFLHARSISFVNPVTGERMTVTAPMAAELEEWLGSV
ncbi:MAG: RluA family pseudouridine synthase [Acidobacteriota bacterium]|nr:RluA family pseudouridine synthase [Acidobacteriota bacterium]